MTNGQSGAEGGSYEYQICDNGSWSIYAFYPVAYNPLLIAHGSIKTREQSYHLTALVEGNLKQFIINGQVVRIFTDTRYTTTSYVALCLNWSNFNSAVSADFSNFKYTPI